MLPEYLRRSFKPATLRTLEKHAAKLVVNSPLFFRTAYAANVTENRRRSYTTVVVVSPSGVSQARCTCLPEIPIDNLCWHIGALLNHCADPDGILPAERFEASLWRAVGFELAAEGRPIQIDTDADPREALLRKLTMTSQEGALLKRGAASARLRWEASPWYRWARGMFSRFPDGEGVRIEQRDDRFHLMAGDATVALPAGAVEHVIAAGGGAVAAASGFEVAPQSLTPSLRIELTAERALRFIPVLLEGQTVHLRETLPRFGKFFFLKPQPPAAGGGRFASAGVVPPMFVERGKTAQTSLFDARPSSGLPLDRETLIAEVDAFAFVEAHREELARMPESLAPDVVRNAQPHRLDGEVVFDFSPPAGNLLDVDIVFEAGGEVVHAGELALARSAGVRALVRGNIWIDAADEQLEWLDDATLGPGGRVLVTKLELLRIRGSLRGRAVFRGDPSCRQIFRVFDELPGAGDAPPPTAFGMDLYGYQQTGYHWLWLLQQNGFGALLCDDMGLGKTHQAIALIRAVTLTNPGAQVLVVCPTSVLDHWRDKLARYDAGPDVTLTSYGLVRTRIEQFRGRRFDLIVLDEMQTIKNAGTATHQMLRSIDTRIAIGLTGTPIENHEGELMTLLDVVVPGYLTGRVEDRAMLQRLVRPFVLRRTKQQVLTELPPKIVDKRHCELTTEQRTLYRRVIEARAKPLRAQLRAGAAVSYVHVFAALNYLKQICNHPASAGGGFDDANVTSGKWELFLELLDECMSSGLKVVVFSQYLKMLEIIERELQRRELGFASIKGTTRARGAEIARFRDDPDCRVFTASLRAGGLGIDLTSASVVIHYDRWWNQAREDQATDRVHRLGQSKGVQVLKLITRGTVEEKIDALIARKAQLADDVIRADDPSLVKQFTVEELQELLAD
ncbi:MAG TPA: DEAD/DEAH box helicase [Thermoanaerobaculia bacterium]|jgi:superfamily II DNA or RNA helicase|nr:DEAD/DEAH box helicase [Thermoanaerobaculia bacterium]